MGTNRLYQVRFPHTNRMTSAWVLAASKNLFHQFGAQKQNLNAFSQGSYTLVHGYHYDYLHYLFLFVFKQQVRVINTDGGRKLVQDGKVFYYFAI